MLRRTVVCLALSAVGLAATPYVPLGLNYTEWGPYFGANLTTPGTVQQIAADSSGALYILSFCTTAVNSPSCFTKLAPDGKTVVWQNTLAFTTPAMAVDPNGGVYLIVPAPTPNAPNAAVEKLSVADGSVLWTAQVAASAGSIAVDATGRAFIGGALCNSTEAPCVIRLNTAGAIDTTFTNVPLHPAILAVDPTGSYIVVAQDLYNIFARLVPGNPTWVVFSPPLLTVSPGLAVAPNGDAVVYGSDYYGNRSLQRIGSTGAVVFSEAIPSQAPPAINAEAPGDLALDAAGNAYITGYTGAFPFPTRNSLAPCGSAWVDVYAPDGSALQISYLPGATSTVYFYGLIAVGSGGALFVLDEADTTFTPTGTGPFPQFPYGTQAGSSALFNLSQNANAQTLPLACVANAATYGTGAVAPGELVAFYGNSLGPQQGVQISGTLQSPFPTQAGSVEVTFDGTPAPLLWVQDSQVNVAVPWSVAGPATQICVTYNSVKTNCLAWPVAQAAPGVFTVDGVHAAAVNQDGTINSASNPAPLNTIVSIYATGLGPIAPSQSDGSLVAWPLPVNSYPVGLGLGIQSGFVVIPEAAPTTYAGPAPLLIAGTTQINFNSNWFLQASSLYVTVQTPSIGAASNYFQVYVAGTIDQ